MEKITNPAIVKRNLVVASLFVTTYEMLKASILDKPKGILCEITGYNDKGITYKTTEAYRKEILERDIPEVTNKKSEFQDFYASCLWLQDFGTIDAADVEVLQAIRQHRNLIAHNPVNLLIDDAINVNLGLLKQAQHLLNKIDKWWILQIDIPTSGEHDADHNLDESNVNSGMTSLLNYFMEVASEEVNSSPEETAGE